MQKDAEQRFMLSFVDMGCQVKLIDNSKTNFAFIDNNNKNTFWIH